MKKIISAFILLNASPAFSGGVSGGTGMMPVQGLELEVNAEDFKAQITELMTSETKLKPIELQIDDKVLKLMPKSFDFKTRKMTTVDSRGDEIILKELPPVE